MLDLMYLPGETQADARCAGGRRDRVMNGDTMLLRQTAAAFNLWTGRDVSLDFLQERLDQVRDQPAEVAIGRTRLPPAATD